MICKVVSTIEKYDLLKNANSICVGVSGGADSFCLLDVLSKLSQQFNFELKAVHVNHNIRGGEAVRDQKAVEDFCAALEIPLNVVSKDVPKLAKQMGVSEEECGRIVRYEAFDSMNCDKVAVAHTLSDSIETMVFNLVRGTALKGLCGIPVKREPNIIRPLIECTREEIERYCEENHINFVTDSTNLKDDYTRNFIRHNIVGNFENVNSNFQANLLRCMQSNRCDNDFLEQMASQTLEKARVKDGYKTSEIMAVHQAVKNRVIAKMIENKLNKPVETRHINLVNEMLNEKKGKIELSKGLYICLNGDIISFCAYVKSMEFWSVDVDDAFIQTPVGNFKLELKSIDEIKKIDYKNMIDADLICGKLQMRARKEKDSFCDPVRKNTKSLKKLFNENKIQPEHRAKIAILSCDNQIVWLEGFGVDNKFKITEQTKNIYILAKEGTFKND